MKIDTDGLADLFFQLKWRSDDAEHTECYAANAVNFWRDILPSPLLTALEDKRTGDRVRVELNNGDGLGQWMENQMIGVSPRQFKPSSKANASLAPRLGRFYPQGVLQGVPGIFRVNKQPFRLVGLENDQLNVDLNHPLAGKPLTLAVTVGQVQPKLTERGGTSSHWLEVLTTGPGMQAPVTGTTTDFFSDDPFAREDTRPDTTFYQSPRLVQHLDDQAIEMVRDLYGRFVQDGMQVLDLMASWDSHLPHDRQLAQVVGVGLNQAELENNQRLSRHLLQDLNSQARLPFETATFDVVTCTVSVEYLTDPVAVFKEVGRILKPDGHFVVTFSNRWFAPKTARIWPELHEFERMGLVSDYFRRSGRFHGLNTYSVRGLLRPKTDKYYAQNPISDPVYAVWAQRSDTP